MEKIEIKRRARTASTHRQRRVSNVKLVEQLETMRDRVPLPTSRIIVQLKMILQRVRIANMRGRALEDLPPIRLSRLQHQALETCLEIMQTKLAMQRGAIRKRSKE